MAIRASDRVTLAVVASPSYVRQYYLLQASTLNPPAAPTTNPPVAPWTTVEPTYTEGSTSTLYTVMLTAYGSATFEYGPVQKSSSYEAAKAAYNKASAAITVANLAEQAAADLIRASQTDPGHAPGRIWIILDAQGRTVGIKQSVNGVWTSYALMADQILVPGSMGTVSMKDGAVTAAKVTASDELWAKIATFAKVTTQHLLAGGATITGTMLADIIQLASRLVAGNPSGDRTELDATGLHVWKDGVERARLSAGGNGLQIRNDSMGALVELSKTAFGAKAISNSTRLNVNSGGVQTWGAWVFEDQSESFTATTDRVIAIFQARAGDYGVVQNFAIQAAVTLRTGAGEISVADTGSDTHFGLSFIPSAMFGVYDVVPGGVYTVRMQFRAARQYSGTGTPWVGERSLVLIPT